MMNSTTLSQVLKGLRSFAALAVVAAASSSAQADPIAFDFTGSGGVGTLVSTFDELPGNALAVGAQALINATPPGSTTPAFDLLYQANVRLIGADGTTPVDTGGFTFTAVARFRETATVVAPGLVTFSLASDQTGSYFSLFAHPPGGPGNNAAGTGFSNDVGGTLIYSAAPGTSGPSGVFSSGGAVGNLDQTNGSPPGTGQQTISGFGGAQITVFTNYFNTDYFRQDPGASTTFNTNNNIPFTDVSPSAQFQLLSGSGSGSTFTSYVTPSLGAINGVNGPDVQFQADASNSFNPAVVPEPASVALTAMGLVGLVGFAARRRASQA